MPTISHTIRGQVTGLWGSATVRDASGHMRELKLGDIVERGDVILTTQDGIVQLNPEVDPSLVVDRVITSLNEGDPETAPAAVFTGGSSGTLSPGLRVERIHESVSPAALPQSAANHAAPPDQAVRDDTSGFPSTPENSAPSAIPGIASGLEDTSLPISLGGSDADGHIVGVTLTGMPTGSTVLLADGVTPVVLGQALSPSDAAGLLFKPAPDFNGGTSLTFTVTDNSGAISPPQSVAINVMAVNDAPVTFADSATTFEDTPISGNLLLNDSDIDGPALSVIGFDVAGTSYAAGATAALNGIGSLTIGADGRYTFTPAANYFGAVPVVTTTVSDGSLTSNSTLTLSVTSVNDAPALAADLASTPINTPLTIDVLANDRDADGDAMTVSNAALTNPAQGTVSVNPDGSLNFVPASNFTGNATLTYTATDGHGTSSTATVTVTVGSNTPPLGADSVHSLAEDGSYTVGASDFGFSDPDLGQTFANVRIDALPAAGTLLLRGTAVSVGTVIAVADVAAGQLVFMPNTDGNGSPYASFSFSVQDSAGIFAAAPNTLGFNVLPAPDPAVISGNTSGATVEDNTLSTSGSLSVVDPDAGETAFVPQTNVAGAHGSFSIDADGAWTYLLNNADPAVQALGAGQSLPSEAFTVATIDGSSTVVSVSISGTNDAPVAHSDVGSVVASSSLAVTAANGLILSAASPSGQDADVDGDALVITKAASGGGSPDTDVSVGGTLLSGTYGDLVLASDGSYHYVANKAGTVAAGTIVGDQFTYQVSDGHGSTSHATLTIQVTGQADTITAPGPTSEPLGNPLGLSGEYYGYTDYNANGSDTIRRHADDGTLGNLDHVADFNTLVNARNAAFGGGNVLGTHTAALANAADAHFTARTIDYGMSPTVDNSLGSNPHIAPGGSIAGLTDANSALYAFLDRAAGGDANSLTITQGLADLGADGLGPNSGLGITSDVGLRLTGNAYLSAGLYDIRITADDGFRLNLDGHTVALYDDIQPPTARVYSDIPITGGLTPLELLYWDQGGAAVLRIEFKLSGAADSSYKLLGTDALPLYSSVNSPVLSDTQDLVAGATPGSYLIRTGATLDGGTGDDTISGSSGRDHLNGGVGHDTLSGGAADDTLIGGKGDDQLTGGSGHDVFRWELNDGATPGTPARDVITDFDNANYSGDILDLRDLLVGETHAANTVALPGTIALDNALTVSANSGNLDSFLHFSLVGNDTVLEVSTTGGFSGGYHSGAVDQIITINGVNLVGGFSSDHQILDDLLQRGKLITDSA